MNEQMLRLLELAWRLRLELHGFRELYDESDPASGKAIDDFDDFLEKSQLREIAERSNDPYLA